MRRQESRTVVNAGLAFLSFGLSILTGFTLAWAFIVVSALLSSSLTGPPTGIIFLAVPAGLIWFSLHLARRSRIPLRWISWPLIAGVSIGFFGFWLLLAITWQMD